MLVASIGWPLEEKIRDDFLAFCAGEGKDAVVRVTQDAKAGHA